MAAEVRPAHIVTEGRSGAGGAGGCGGLGGRVSTQKHTPHVGALATGDRWTRSWRRRSAPAPAPPQLRPPAPPPEAHDEVQICAQGDQGSVSMRENSSKERKEKLMKSRRPRLVLL